MMGFGLVGGQPKPIVFVRRFMEWIFLGVVMLVLASVVWQMIADHASRKQMTEEEWEKRERAGGSLLGASAMGLHQIFQADMKKAAAVQEDAEQGMLPSAERENNRQ
jgi:hypothetical protein